MNTKRIIAVAATLAGITGAVALAAGSSAAWAADLSATPPASSDAATATSTQNELSQLRANQQLLQQRLNQLEQIAQVGPAHPVLPPGTTSLAGSFPRSFLIPGTDTSIEVGGQAELDMTEFLQGGNPNTSNSSTSTGYGGATIAGLPLNGTAAAARSQDVFFMNVQNSRLFVETQTPTAFGLAKTHIEFDFASCTAGATASANCSNSLTFVNPLIPRLRLAYATLGPWMFGQNWGIGFDLASMPEEFNSTGQVGTWGRARLPEASYTFSFPSMFGATTLQVGIEMPESSLGTPLGLPLATDTAGVPAASGALVENPLKNEWPEPAFALTFNQPWGHVQAHADMMETYLNDGLGLNQSFLGGGGGFSGDFKLGAMGGGKDSIGWSGWAGKGDLVDNGSPANWFAPSVVSNFGAPGMYGHAGVPLTAANAALLSFQVPTEMGGNIWYQHWWTPVVRSTFDFGYAQQNLSSALLAGAGLTTYNHSEKLAIANLIWSPVPFVNTGFEFFYGNRTTVNYHTGDEIGLDYSFVMKF
jgi:hypothetical protein